MSTVESEKKPRRAPRRQIARDVMTTGDVAKLFQVAPRTISNWLDKGHLPGWRIPGSPDRRFRRADVVRWGIEHGMLLPEEDVVVCVGLMERSVTSLKYHLDSAAVVRVEHSIPGVVRELKSGAFAVLVDTGMGTESASRWLRAIPAAGRHHVLAFGACEVEGLSEMPHVAHLGRVGMEVIAARLAALLPARDDRPIRHHTAP